MKSSLTLSDITIEINRKRIKNIYLRVYPSEGRVVLNCPWHMRQPNVKMFAEKKIPWIKKHLKKREVHFSRDEPQYLDGDAITVWGEMVQLKLERAQKRQHVILPGNGSLIMQVKENSTVEARNKLLQSWYRRQLKQKIPPLITKWEPEMQVSVREFRVKKMKTRWGTCNTFKRRIWLNLELAKFDPECLEFIVVHEMVHLLERGHTKRFYRLMDSFLPGWKKSENLLKNGIHQPVQNKKM